MVTRVKDATMPPPPPPNTLSCSMREVGIPDQTVLSTLSVVEHWRSGQTQMTPKLSQEWRFAEVNFLRIQTSSDVCTCMFVNIFALTTNPLGVKWSNVHSSWFSFAAWRFARIEYGKWIDYTKRPSVKNIVYFWPSSIHELKLSRIKNWIYYTERVSI